MPFKRSRKRSPRRAPDKTSAPELALEMQGRLDAQYRENVRLHEQVAALRRDVAAERKTHEHLVELLRHVGLGRTPPPAAVIVQAMEASSAAQREQVCKLLARQRTCQRR